MSKFLKSSVSAVILSSLLLGNALAAEVTSIAILTPEEGTDYG
ncbi:MAG: BMP family ABC transporter substrate-binding protein, partial [Mesorhizobium sp.]